MQQFLHDAQAQRRSSYFVAKLSCDIKTNSIIFCIFVR